MREARLVRAEIGHERPEIARIHRREDGRAHRIRDPVHDGPRLRPQRAEVSRANDQIEVPAEAGFAFGFDAERVTHGAARTVGTDDVAGTDLERRTILARRGDSHGLTIVLEAEELDAEMQRHVRQFGERVAQHALDLVLRDPLRAFGEALVARAIAEEGVTEMCQLVTVEPRLEDDIRRVIRRKRRRGAQGLRDAPAAHVLDRAHMGRLGARRPASAILLLDQRDTNAAMAEFQRGREASRPGPDDEDGQKVATARDGPGRGQRLGGHDRLSRSGFGVVDEVVGAVRAPEVEGIVIRTIFRRPGLVDRHIVHVGGIFAETAPRILDVVEEVRS